MRGPFDRGWATIICVASGPSLTAEQAETIRRAHAAGPWRVIAANTTALTLVPFADVLYGGDAAWWTRYHAEVRARFTGETWSQSQAAAAHGARVIRRLYQAGLTKESDAINGGGNSGYAMVELAYLFGVQRLVLVGYDMQRTGGKSHHHGDHPSPNLGNPQDKQLAVWAAKFPALARDLAAAGVEVVNCTSTTALTCFPRADLAATLNVPLPEAA